MELGNKEELVKILEDIQSRLAMVEDGLTKEGPTDDPADDPTYAPEDTAGEEPEVESEDEIEKLLEG